MKKFTLILLTTLFAFGLSAQSNKKMLCQEWRVDAEAFKESLPKELMAMMEMLPDDQKAEAMKNFDKMGEMKIIFFKDGSWKRTSKDKEGEFEMGTWEFIDDETAIKSVSEKKETILDIELTSSSLKLKDRENEKDPGLPLIPTVEE